MRRILLAALAGVGCLGDPAPFRCDLRGGDRACDLVSGAVCVDQYCAEPVSNALCASGFRYTATAATPGACASPRDASADDVVDATETDAPRDAPAPDDTPTPTDRPLFDVVDAGGAPDVPTIDVTSDAVDAPQGHRRRRRDGRPRRGRRSLGVGTDIRAVAAGADLTGDGRADVAISYGGQVRVFPGGPGGALDIVPEVPHGSFADVMTAGVDGDGDGIRELVVRNGIANALHVYRYTVGGFVRELRLDGTATDAATLLAPGDMDNMRSDELVVLDTAGQVRVRRGGASSDVSRGCDWSAQAGVLLAGTSSPEVVGRFWYARSQSFTQHGIEVVGMSGGSLTSQLANTLFMSAVRLVAR